MRELYRFWSDCLHKSFNVRMYEEFRLCALEDARGEVPATFGLKQLLGYYKQILGQSRQPVWRNGKPYPAIFLNHQMEAQQLWDSSERLPNGSEQA